MPEPDLYVKRSYCSEHMERDHWLDENFVCQGRDLAEVEVPWLHLGATHWRRLV